MTPETSAMVIETCESGLRILGNSVDVSQVGDQFCCEVWIRGKAYRLQPKEWPEDGGESTARDICSAWSREIGGIKRLLSSMAYFGVR